MAFVHNVKIVWNELIDAFTSDKGDRIYFLDCITGEIFFVPTNLDDDQFWWHIDRNKERFLSIPSYNYDDENEILSGFISDIEDSELKNILSGTKTGKKPYGKVDDILSFFPDENERFQEIKDEILTCRVKKWLENNNLITFESQSTNKSSYMA